MTKSKKSPLKRSPRNNAGDSVGKYFDESFDCQILPLLLSPAILLLFALWHWMFYKGLIGSSPWLTTVIAVASVVFSIIRLRTVTSRLRAIRQGQLGEMAVGQFLDGLQADGYKVFHDIPGEGFNIDHVILGTRGFYTVETKTLSKPQSGSPRICVTEGGLTIDGGPVSADYLVQANSQSVWLGNKLEELTGKRWPVKPVLTFPGWFIEPNKTKAYRNIWVLEPKAIPKFLEREAETLSPPDVSLAASSLSRYIRSEIELG